MRRLPKGFQIVIPVLVPSAMTSYKLSNGHSVHRMVQPRPAMSAYVWNQRDKMCHQQFNDGTMHTADVYFEDALLAQLIYDGKLNHSSSTEREKYIECLLDMNVIQAICMGDVVDIDSHWMPSHIHGSF